MACMVQKKSWEGQGAELYFGPSNLEGGQDDFSRQVQHFVRLGFINASISIKLSKKSRRNASFFIADVEH